MANPPMYFYNSSLDPHLCKWKNNATNNILKIVHNHPWWNQSLLLFHVWSRNIDHHHPHPDCLNQLTWLSRSTYSLSSCRDWWWCDSKLVLSVWAKIICSCERRQERLRQNFERMLANGTLIDPPFYRETELENSVVYQPERSLCEDHVSQFSKGGLLC